MPSGSQPLWGGTGRLRWRAKHLDYADGCAAGLRIGTRRGLVAGLVLGAILTLAVLALGCRFDARGAAGDDASSTSSSSTDASSGVVDDSSSSSTDASSAEPAGTSAAAGSADATSSAEPGDSSTTSAWSSSSTSSTGDTCTPDYGPCTRSDECCGDAGCFEAVGTPTVRWCTSSCISLGDCDPAPRGSSAPADCAPVCLLSCAQGEQCPAGMSCSGYVCGYP